MASKISINLDTSKELFLNSKCKQNDDLILEANIYENGLAKDLTNCSISIQALKADKTYIIQNTDIAKEKNKFIANLVKDFTRVAGKTLIEVVLTESGKQNTTFSFYIEVVGSVIKGAVESNNTVTILENLQDKIEEAGQVKAETEQLIATGGAATKGDIATVNSHLEQIVYLDNADTGINNSKKIQEQLDQNTNINIKSKNNNEYIIKNTIEIDSNNSIIMDNNTVLKNATLNNMLRKKGTVDRLKNIRLSGGIYNYANQTSGGNGLHAIFFHKIDDLLIEKLQVLNASKYCFLLADVNRATVKDITLNTSSDGIHFQPPLKDIYVENIKGTTHDDMVAITIGDYEAYNTSVGDVENVYINGIYPNNSMRALKLCGQEGYKFKNLVVENVYGSTYMEGFYFRIDGTILNNFSADYIKLKNINLKVPDTYALLRINGNEIDTLILEDVQLHDNYLLDIRGTTHIKNLYLKDIKSVISDSANTRKYNCFVDMNCVIDNLYLENIDITPSNIGKFECFLENRGTIKNIYINGVKLNLADNTGALIRNINGTINNFFVDNYYQYKGLNFYFQSTSDYNSVANLNNVLFDDVYLAFNIKASTIFNMTNVSTNRNGSTFAFTNSSGTYKLLGNFINTYNEFTNCISSSSVGSIYVNGDIPVDVERVLGNKGDRCKNTNNTILTGRGTYVNDVFDWVLATGTKYYLYKNTDFAVGKYESIYRCNGNLTITLPNPSNIKGKEYVFIPSSSNTLIINNYDGSNVGSATTTIKALSIGSGWLLY